MKRFLSLILATCLVMGSSMTVFAADISAPGTQNVDVSLVVGASFTVTVPTSITPNVSDGTGTANYSVTAKGDIEGDQKVTVTVPSTFTMTQAGKSDITASITQAKQEFSCAELAVKQDDTLVGTTTTGSISIPGLTAGTWSGTFVFTVGKTEA